MPLNEMICHWNIGIDQANWNMTNEEGIRFFAVENGPEVPGYGYIGSALR